jgi:hypothetical protein
MTHAQANERLDDFASGELPDIERRLLQRHLDECGECRAEVEAIQSLLSAASELPRGITPPVDLWAGIASRVAETRQEQSSVAAPTPVIPLVAPRRGWQAPPRWALQAAAAVVLMLASSGVTALLMRRGAVPGGPAALGPVAVTAPSRATSGSGVPGVPVTGSDSPSAATGAQPAASTQAVGAPATQYAPSSATLAANTTRRGSAATRPAEITALAAFRPAERTYQRAVDDLVRVLESKRGEMAPETAATLERNLRIIDAAIAESRTALERDPNSRELTHLLTASYDAKVQLLRQAVEL